MMNTQRHCAISYSGKFKNQMAHLLKSSDIAHLYVNIYWDVDSNYFSDFTPETKEKLGDKWKLVRIMSVKCIEYIHACKAREANFMNNSRRLLVPQGNLKIKHKSNMHNRYLLMKNAGRTAADAEHPDSDEEYTCVVKAFHYMRLHNIESEHVRAIIKCFHENRE